jgi:hypothetical protein
MIVIKKKLKEAAAFDERAVQIALYRSMIPVFKLYVGKLDTGVFDLFKDGADLGSALVAAIDGQLRNSISTKEGQRDYMSGLRDVLGNYLTKFNPR